VDNIPLAEIESNALSD